MGDREPVGEDYRELFEHSPIAAWVQDLSAISGRFGKLRASGVTDLEIHLASHPGELMALAARIRTLAVNAAGLRLMGLECAEDLDRDLPRSFTDESLAVLRREFAALFRGELRFQAEVPQVDGMGREIQLELRVAVMPGHEADLSRVVATFTGRAGPSRAQADAGQSQRMDSLRRLAGGVVHEMNNVLGIIMMVGSLIKAGHAQDSGLQEDAETLMRAAGRGRDLVKGLQGFSRKELDSAAALDLNEMVRLEAGRLQGGALERVEVVLDLVEPLPRILGDAGSLQDALMDLCLNSVEAMPQRGRITLATRNLGQGWVELSVADDGRGMPPEVAAQALEPFYTTKPSRKGAGLGLSKVYGTMKAHRGTVAIHSEAGSGTRVALRFPCSQPPGAAEGPGGLGGTPS